MRDTLGKWRVGTTRGEKKVTKKAREGVAYDVRLQKTRRSACRRHTR